MNPFTEFHEAATSRVTAEEVDLETGKFFVHLKVVLLWTSRS